MDKAGRPTKYNKELLKKAKKLAKKGLSNVEISIQLGISKCTFYQFMIDYPEFAYALNKG